MRKWFNKHRHELDKLCDRVFDGMELLVLASYVTNLVIKDRTGKQSIPVLILFYISFVLGLTAFVLSIILSSYNKKRDRRKLYTHNIAANFLDVVEDVLDEYNITIPDEAREGGEEEARLYGMIYDRMLYLMEISVIATLESVRGDDFELITDVFEGCKPPDKTNSKG